MLQFDGNCNLPGSPTVLWPLLRDAGFLAACIPEATVTGTPGKDRATCTVRPGFAFVRGSLDVTIDVVEAVEPSRLRLLQISKGIGTSSELETILTLSPAEPGTRVQWSAEVKRLGGLLKAVPTGLIRGAAQKVIDDVWQGIEKKVRESCGEAK